MKSRLFFLPLAVLFAGHVHADFDSAFDAYQKKDYAAAAREFQQLARLGEVASQRNLGVMYLKGEGVGKDLVESYAWLALASENEPAQAQDIQSKVLKKLSAEDRAKAETRFQQLHDEFGSAAITQRLLPELVDSANYWETAKPIKKVVPDYPRGAAIEGIEGVVTLRYRIGTDGRVRDARVEQSIPAKVFDEASLRVLRKWKFEVPETHSEGAWMRTIVNFRMANGARPIVDIAKLEAIKASAEAGSSQAQYVYSQGLLLHQIKVRDKQEKSIKWLTKAAQGGVPDAQYHLGTDLLEGAGCRSDFTKGRVWLGLAAQAGQASAQYDLAQLLSRHPAFKHDKEKARLWLEQAAAGGHALAQRDLAWRLATDLSEADRDGARASDLLTRAMKGKKSMNKAPEFLEVSAAIAAELGDFTNAVKTQKQAIDEAEFRDWDVARMRDRLDAYESRKPWRE